MPPDKVALVLDEEVDRLVLGVEVVGSAVEGVVPLKDLLLVAGELVPVVLARGVALAQVLLLLGGVAAVMRGLLVEPRASLVGRRSHAPPAHGVLGRGSPSVGGHESALVHMGVGALGRLLVVSILVRSHVHIGAAPSLRRHHVLRRRHIRVALVWVLRRHFLPFLGLLLVGRVLLLLLLSLGRHLLLGVW